MNDTNNNLNGTVLGNVDSNPSVSNNSTPNDTVETLDGMNSNVMVGSQVMDSSLQQPNPQQVMQPETVQQPTQSTFFNNPPVNDTNQMGTGVESSVIQPDPMIMEPTPQVDTTPAYTNPQSINPAPMPGFENPGTIGTTPPISLEPEKKPKKKSNKLLFIIIILVVLAGVGFGTYYVLNYTDLLNKTEQISIEAKTLEVNMGDALSTNIADYATITGTDSRNCSLNTESVDTTKEGTYLFKVTCGETVKSGNVVVVDNTVLVIETEKVYKAKGETLDAKEFILNEDEEITYEFVNQTEVDTLLDGEAGTYTVKIKATKNSKTTEVDGTLVIIEYPIKGYLICSSNEQNVAGSNAKMTVSEKFAIINDGNNSYGKIATETHTFKYTDETEYTTLLANYKTNNEITINNVTGNTTFDDTNFTITISNELENDSVVAKYGEANLQKYSTIKTYFEGTLGYKCTYVIKGQ